jgi:PEP-CTERM motif
MGDFMKTILGVLAAMFVFAATTLANTVPVRTRSSYGQTESTILATGSTSADGVTIASEEFCSDANTNPTSGTCQLGFAFQITSALPSNAQSLTLTLPVPSGGTLLSAGLLTNDDVPQAGDSFNLFFSPFSQSDILGLSPSAILFGNTSGNPFFTFALPFPLTGGGTGLSLFMDVSDNNSINNDGTYCFQQGTSGGCTAADLPSIPTVGINLQQTTAAPEPASLSLFASGLLGLGLLRRRRKSR